MLKIVSEAVDLNFNLIIKLVFYRKIYCFPYPIDHIKGKKFLSHHTSKVLNMSTGREGEGCYKNRELYYYLHYCKFKNSILGYGDFPVI